MNVLLVPVIYHAPAVVVPARKVEALALCKRDEKLRPGEAEIAGKDEVEVVGGERKVRKEAQRRIGLLEVNNRLKTAGEIGYIDINLPGIDGKPVALSQVESKVTMLYFWASTAQQKMFNLDALIPIYEEFHDKGFEVYAVSLDADKSAWAAAVKNQKLPWVNVCDTRGVQSPYISSYGIGSLPMAWFIVDDALDTDAKVSNAADIRNYLRKKL